MIWKSYFHLVIYRNRQHLQQLTMPRHQRQVHRQNLKETQTLGQIGRWNNYSTWVLWYVVLYAASLLLRNIYFIIRNINLYLRFCRCENQLFTLSWRRSLSYRNQSIDLLCKSMGWILYDRDSRHDRVKVFCL